MSSRYWLTCAVRATGVLVALSPAGCASGTSASALGHGSGDAGGAGGAGGAASSATSSVTTSSTSGGGQASSGGGGGGGGGEGSAGLPLGVDCTGDADCASGHCKQDPWRSGKDICVLPCTKQQDCAAAAGFFCDPASAGATSGYCVPHSPTHCLSCASDADCGSLSEACFLAPGDSDKACHIDCSLSGASACPPEYTCADETVNGQPRKLCRPNVPSCLDAIGGYCDRVHDPEPCQRTSADGTCTGQRSCLSGSGRFDSCSAATPQCKADCSQADPTGCMLDYCAGATTTPDHCGSCGNVCPGYQTPHANVTCAAGATCTFACQGENYDVNNLPSNGCEAADSPTGNHVSTSATLIGGTGGISCNDGNGATVQIAGRIVSDRRVHQNPGVAGLDPTTGGAPDFYVINATGGLCTNDMDLTLQMSGSIIPSCYRLTVTAPGVSTYTASTSSAGTARISLGSGSYQDDTRLLIKVEKTCGSLGAENVTYTVVGHL